MRPNWPQLHNTYSHGRPGTWRDSAHSGKLMHTPFRCESNKNQQTTRWRRPGFGLCSSILAAFLSFVVLTPATMEAFLRPASAFPPLLQALQRGPLKVTLIGSGNWGTAVGRLVATNAKESFIFNTTVKMWVFEEEFEGRRLTDWINNEHENKKYLPGCKLPTNLQATASLEEACKDADMLVFVMPHQFLEGACRKLRKLSLLPPHARAISLIKGMGVRNDWPVTLTYEIGRSLGLPKPCVLSGANVAQDVAKDNFAEATIGHAEGEADTAALWQLLFDRPNFKVNVLPDVEGVELCGALKNVVALAGGICEGMGQGTNTKAAILRLGVEEIRAFIMLFFGELLADTLYDSAGYADVITTVFGGRNARVAAEFVRQRGTKTWSELEEQMLKGQKLQGPGTLQLVARLVRKHEVEHLFPLFMATYRVSFEKANPESILDVFRTSRPRGIQRSEDCVKLRVPSLVQHARERIMARLQHPGQASLSTLSGPDDEHDTLQVA